jgi:hypothetical protein
MGCQRVLDAWKAQTWVHEVDPVTLSDRVPRRSMLQLDRQTYDVRSLMQVLASGSRRVPHNRRRITNTELANILMKYAEFRLNARFIRVFLEAGIALPSGPGSDPDPTEFVRAACAAWYSGAGARYMVAKALEAALDVLSRSCNAKRVVAACKGDVTRLIRRFKEGAPRSTRVERLLKSLRNSSLADGTKFRIAASIAVTFMLEMYLALGSNFF